MNKKLVFIFGVCFYITGLFLYSYYNFIIEQRKIYQYSDLNLENAIKQSVHLLKEDIIDTSLSEKIISQETFLNDSTKLSKFCKNVNLHKITFLIKKGDSFYILLSSDNEYNIKYSDNHSTLATTYDTNTSHFENRYIKDNKFRTFYYPLEIDNSKLILIGELSYNHIKNMSHINFIKTFLFGLFSLLFIVPFIALLFNSDKKLKSDLENQLYFESITKLPNKKSLFKEISNNNHNVLFLFNIDSLKKFNEFFGYDAGNAIINTLNKILSFWIDENSKVFNFYPKLYRLDKDEFAILINNELSDTTISKVSESIKKIITKKPFIFKKYYLPVSIKMGVAYKHEMSSKKSYKPHHLLFYCDLALKASKKENTFFTLYNTMPSLYDVFNENKKWTNNILKSIFNNNIVPYFQPIINNETGTIEKFECLMRMKDEKGELILPSNFLQVAKDSNTYPKLTQIMVSKSFDIFSNSIFDFTLNIALEDIENTETRNFIYDVIEKYPETAQRCIFEIVETENISTNHSVEKFIKHVKARNCRIAIDDFGSGYSNFRYLANMKIDFLKIDSSMIKNIHNDDDSKIITETIVEFCQRKKISTIAQFVYNKAVYNEVITMGIDYSQGYYLGEPSGKLVS